jgi:hypothetical protein
LIHSLAVQAFVLGSALSFLHKPSKEEGEEFLKSISNHRYTVLKIVPGLINLIYRRLGIYVLSGPAWG